MAWNKQEITLGHILLINAQNKSTENTDGHRQFKAMMTLS